jgi:drug/metabolite transporter (DMT)-like permease
MPSDQKQPVPTLLVFIAFATVYIVWGSTYFFIRIAEQGGFPPFFLGAVRFIIAGLLMMGWCLINGEKVFIKQSILPAAVSGVLLLFVANGSVIWVEQTLPSAMVAIMVSLTPIWFVLIDKPNWSVNLKNRSAIMGLIIGFFGVILLFSEQVDALFSTGIVHSKLPWMLLLLLGSVAWASGSLYSKYKLPNVSASVNTTWQMLAAGVVFIPCSFLHHEYNTLNLQNITVSGWGALVYLMLFGSIAAFSAYVWLLKVRPATQVSTYAYVNPVIAVILGVLFAKESISLLQISGLFIILTSVLLINLDKYRKSVSG